MVSKELYVQLGRIAADRTRGAGELVREAAQAIAQAAAGGEGRSVEEGEPFAELARAVVRAQPEMAPFYHLAAAILPCRAVQALGETVEAFLRALQGDSIARFAAEVIPPHGSVATYSRSGSVVAALAAARSSGKTFEVWVGEGRPGLEGRGVATALAEAGLPVLLLTDAALLSRIDDADLVMVGADAVGRESFVNKVGTKALCVMARLAGRPVYVLADETKLFPEELWPPLRERSGEELWSDAPGGVRVANPYFEAIALAEVEAVITGAGLVAPAAIGAKVDAAAAYLGRLRELLAGE